MITTILVIALLILIVGASIMFGITYAAFTVASQIPIAGWIAIGVVITIVILKRRKFKKIAKSKESITKTDKSYIDSVSKPVIEKPRLRESSTPISRRLGG